MVTVVNTQTLRVEGVVRFGKGTTINALAWLSPRRVVAVYNDVIVAGFDPVSRRMVWQHRLPPVGYENSARWGSRLLFLVPASTGVGPTTFISVDASGTLRTLTLTSVRSGAKDAPDGTSIQTGSSPAIAVDHAGTAYIISSGDPIAQVDLRAFTVSYHSPPRALASQAHGLVGSDLGAVWLGNGNIAVTGLVGTEATDANGKPTVDETPAGLSLLDTHAWTSRLLDPNVTDAIDAGNLILGFGATLTSTANHTILNGNGISAYTHTGAAAFHLLNRTPISDLQTSHGLAYAPTRTAVTIIDMTSGTILRTARVPTSTDLLITPPT